MIGNNELIDNKFHGLKEELLDYDWKYRLKICTKCPLETQERLRCFRVNNYKNNIQETHCSKMDKARVQKFRGRMNNLLNMASFNFYGKGKYTQQKQDSVM
jgi:hypothetical protein